MPNAQITNPLGINVAQGGALVTSQSLAVYATDPAGNTHAISGITTANPGVVTTSTDHGFLTGDLVTITGVVGATQANGTFKVTRLSATTYSIPVNVTGTYSSGGTAVGPFHIGNVVELQGWNGSASSDAAASPYPTVKLSASTGDALTVGVIVGGESPGTAPINGGLVQVCTAGIAAVYVDDTTAIGNNLIQAADTGIAAVGVAASSENIGTALAVVAGTAAAPALCQVLVRLS